MSAAGLVRPVGWAVVVALTILGPADGGRSQTSEGARELAGVAARLAEEWQTRAADAIARRLPEDGIRLDLDADHHEGVGRRQAVAALDRFLRRWEGGAVEVRRAELLGGEPARGLIELMWRTRATGTPESRSFVIFVSLERSLGTWSVGEIRVFS